MTSLLLASNQPQPLFARADEKFNDLKAFLLSAEGGSLDAAGAEASIAVKGAEIMRVLLEDHFNWCNTATVVEPVVGADGRARGCVRQGTGRDLVTTFGNVRILRPAFYERHASLLAPHDAALNLPPDLYSFPLRKQVAMNAAQMAYDSTVANVDSTTAGHVPKRQAEQLTAKSAQDFNAFYERRVVPMPQAESNSTFLVLTLDRKGVAMRHKDLTPETRRRAEKAKPKLETRQTKGEKANQKRMAVVAAVYTVAPYVRTPEQVVAGLRHIRDASPPKRPKPQDKRVWATLQKSVEEVVKDAFDDADRRDPHHSKTWLALVDGESGLERLVAKEAKQRGVKVKPVLDFIHAVEYLWRASTSFHQEASREREQWVLDRLTRLLHGRCSSVAAGMRRSATLKKLSADERKPVDKAANYLLKRKAMMDYGTLLAAGAPIATGIIEGACRHLICDRMDITGARWSLVGAEAILRLRALKSSGDFEEYWAFHEAQELQRNHAKTYAGGKMPRTELRLQGKPQLRVVK